jgi:hypothetical protein
MKITPTVAILIGIAAILVIFVLAVKVNTP